MKPLSVVAAGWFCCAILGATAAILGATAAILGATAAAAEPSPTAPRLPSAPLGVSVRVAGQFSVGDQEPVRIAADAAGNRLYVLGGGGDVFTVDVASQTVRRVLAAGDYLTDLPPSDALNIPLPVDAAVVNAPISLRKTLCLGLTVDSARRLYIVANVQVPGGIYANRVDIYRTPPLTGDALPERPALWTRFAYPYGIGGFNHGACRIAQGPDGKIYLGSGSRTDHGEPGDDAHYSPLGEAPHPQVAGGPGLAGGDFTASILRFDPETGQQAPEVISRGNRNPFGLDWDGQGRLIDAEHGPMADHPEELNHIQAGKHYGFPYVFGNGEAPAYADAVPAPAGLAFEPPIRNLGPAGILGVNPMYSLSPHAAPGGLAYYAGGELPRPYHGCFFLARFGNLVNYNRIGFDVLAIRLEDQQGALVARTERFLDGLARPIDLCVLGGKLYVLEYCAQRETAGPASGGFSEPGRVIEVAGG